MQVFWSTGPFFFYFLKELSIKWNRFSSLSYGREVSLINSSRAKVTWNFVCFCKKKGDLGVKNLKFWNKAAILNYVWLAIYPPMVLVPLSGPIGFIQIFSKIGVVGMSTLQGIALDLGGRFWILEALYIWNNVSWLMVLSCVFFLRLSGLGRVCGIVALRCFGTRLCGMVKLFIATPLFYLMQLEEGCLPKTDWLFTKKWHEIWCCYWLTSWDKMCFFVGWVRRIWLSAFFLSILRNYFV